MKTKKSREELQDDRIDQLGQVVKKIRLSLGLTQSEVAEALHVTPGYISNVENNRTAMSLRVLVYYAELTNTTLDTLVGLTQTDYQATALDNDIMRAISSLDRRDKEKLLQTIRIWTE
ncbi:MAG: helix-turn-helix transcriptional regulator [Blautia sp.]|nr:helix-turn-helix transcriptional regulator [Blautia sp.]